MLTYIYKKLSRTPGQIPWQPQMNLKSSQGKRTPEFRRTSVRLLKYFISGVMKTKLTEISKVRNEKQKTKNLQTKNSLPRKKTFKI